MTARAWNTWVAVAVVLIVAIGTAGLTGIGAAHSAAPLATGSTTPASTGAVAPTQSSSTTSAPSPANIVTPTSSANPADAAAQRALDAAQSAGISPNFVLVPAPSASPSQIAQSAQQGYVTPGYSAAPSPVGLADYGLSQNTTTGNLTPSLLNTTSVQATFDPTVNGPSATYLPDSSPDGYGVQLNAVVTNVTLFGNDTYQFWTQNVIEYYPYSGIMYLITNVWNFSSPASFLSSNVFYAHGPLGTQVGNEYYYAAAGPFYNVYYPFNTTFTMTSSLVGGRNAVNFSFVATAPNGSAIINGTNYDYVIFNSIANGTGPVLTPANYQADGFNYNPLGLTNDFELTIGGPGGGSQTTFLSANANETLSYWAGNATNGSYQAVPSAYTHGGETGETASGAGMSWATGANGQPYGIMSTGASLSGGLWNASSPAGGPAMLELNVTPGNAFVLVSYAGSSTSAFNSTAVAWAGTVTTSTLYLPAGTYNFSLQLSDYNETNFQLTVNGGSTYYLNYSLSWNASMGVYTPLWAWTDAQIGAISWSGNGTLASPYQLVNNENGTLASFWGVLNDYLFPQFPGIYLIGTSAYVDINNPASFAVDTYLYLSLPQNNLPFWFYGTSNVALTNATDITGWFSTFAFDYPYFLTFNVEFWNSTGMLIYNNTFNTEAMALLLYNGQTFLNPGADGYAVVWGNTFNQVLTSNPDLLGVNIGLGLDEQENSDLIFNNAFFTATTAVSIPEDLYTGSPLYYADTWNVTPMNATNVTVDSNWPAFLMNGTIFGASVNGSGLQGGNYWADYGLLYSAFSFCSALGCPPSNVNHNPYGYLPYTESGWIIQPGGGPNGGGDYAPLTFTPLFTITVNAMGLPADWGWSYQVTFPGNASYGGYTFVFWANDVSGSNDSFLLTGFPVFTYNITAEATGYAVTAMQFTVSGNTTVNLTFVPQPQVVSFYESGLPTNTAWVLQLNGAVHSTNSAWLNFTLLTGNYSWSAAAVGSGWTSPSGSFFLSSNQTVDVMFFSTSAIPQEVYVTQSGLQSGVPWTFDFNGTNYTSSSATISIGPVSPGSYSYSISGPAGYSVTPSNGTITVTSAPVSFGVTFTSITYTVTFMESGLTNGTLWAVSLNGVILGSNGTSINFTMVPGTYNYQVAFIPGWTATPSLGSVTVVGTSIIVNIAFSIR